MVRLLPGVSATHAQEVLQQVANQFRNVRGSMSDPVLTYTRYVETAATWGRLLFNILPAADLDRVLTTRRYWMLQSLDPVGRGAALAALMDVELEEKARVLDEAAKWLADEAARFDSAKLIVVPDTNLLLHHPKPIDQFPWDELTTWDTRRRVLVTIPILVVDELDKAKLRTEKNADGKVSIRTRARSTLATLERWFESGDTFRLGVARAAEPDPTVIDVTLLLDDPDRERLPDPDYELIDQARALKDLTGARVVIATIDSGMRLRARAAGVEAKDPTTRP